MKVYFYGALGWLCIVLGAIGVVTPVLPTTPFILLAAFFFSRSSPRFDRWLRAHKTFGPAIRDWEANRCIPVRAKLLSVSMMTLSGSYVVWKPTLSPTVKIVTVISLVLIAAYVVSRPSKPLTGA